VAEQLKEQREDLEDQKESFHGDTFKGKGADPGKAVPGLGGPGTRG